MIKLEFSSAEEFKAAFRDDERRAEIRRLVGSVGNFLQNTSDFTSKQYDLGTFIILNAERFTRSDQWELLHAEARAKGYERKK